MHTTTLQAASLYWLNSEDCQVHEGQIEGSTLYFVIDKVPLSKLNVLEDYLLKVTNQHVATRLLVSKRLRIEVRVLDHRK